MDSMINQFKSHFFNGLMRVDFQLIPVELFIIQ